MKVIIDKKLCTGFGLCLDTCPEVFKMDKDIAIAFVNPVPPNAEAKCRIARDECPGEAIKIVE